MSVIVCKHCGKYIDTDFDCEHEELCEMEKEDKPYTYYFDLIGEVSEFGPLKRIFGDINESMKGFGFDKKIGATSVITTAQVKTSRRFTIEELQVARKVLEEQANEKITDFGTISVKWDREKSDGLIKKNED